MRPIISDPTYLGARMVADTVAAHFSNHLQAAAGRFTQAELASAPDSSIIEAVTDIAFWASLRQEEGRSPDISMALLQPSQAAYPLLFSEPLRFTPQNLVKLAPAVEQRGIHLGIWHNDDGLYIWGTTHMVPGICFVLEVVEPGFLVIKHRRVDGFGKFVNVAVLLGDQVKVVDENTTGIADCPALIASLAAMPLPSYMGERFNVLVQLAAAMRMHGRGGLLLIVPPGTNSWQQSVLQPINYPVAPAYRALPALMAHRQEKHTQPEWREAVLQTIELIGGFTAVDGATVVTSEYELLGFGAKITQLDSNTPVPEIILTEPVAGSTAIRMQPSQYGGTRHLAAAQFVHDQPDAIALVASQDKHFTVFAWSAPLQCVHAHRIDVLLV